MMAVKVSVNADAHHTADVPFHYSRLRISGRGFARMEQPVDVTDSFQSAP